LIRKNKVIELDWAAMDFLFDIVEEQKKRFQMEDLILLLLRIGVILFLVLALARPVLDSGIGFGGEQSVLAIDDTYSMATKSGTKTRFQRAGEAADSLLGKMSGSDSSALVLHRAESKKVVGSFSADKALISETIDKLRVSDYHGRGPSGLKTSLEILQKENPAAATVYFISDFQKSEWQQPSAELLETIKELQKKTDVIFVNAGDDETSNLSVEEVRCLQEAVKVNEPVFFAVKIKNHGTDDVPEAPVYFSVNKQVSETMSVSVPAGQTSQLIFKTTVDAPGYHSAGIRIGVDANEQDNTGFAHFKAFEALKVLVLQSFTPSTIDEKRSLFWDFAMNPYPGASQSENALYKFSWSSAQALSSEDLAQYSFIILDNVPALTSTENKFLEDYVSQGGGVLINLGPNVDVENYNAVLHNDGKGLMAWPLMDTAIEEKEEGKSLNVEIENSKHGIWSFTDDTEIAGFRLKKTYGFLKLKSERAFSLMKLRTDGDERSVIASFQFNKGRVVVVGTTSGMEWNNMAQLPTFLPFCRRVSSWLMEKNFGERTQQIGSGIYEELPEDKTRASWELISPSGVKESLIADISAGKPYLNVSSFKEAGVYSLKESGLSDVRLISVNRDNSESDVTSMTSDELKDTYGKMGVIVTDVKGLSTLTTTASASEISVLLLLLAALCWLGENILAAVISRRGQHG
jgi:hypothetical protein